MSGKAKILITLGIVAVAAVVFIKYLSPGNFVIFQGSILGEPEAVLPPDLGIESVALKKTGDPKDGFNYYKYLATVVVKNYGGDLENAQVVLHGGANQKFSFVKNTEAGFSLKENKTYIIKDYEAVFDGNYNGGKIDFGIELKNVADVNKENDNFASPIDFEAPAKVRDLEIKEVMKNGKISLNFDPNNFKDFKIEYLASDTQNLDEKNPGYTELPQTDGIYSYYRIKNSGDAVTARNWKTVSKDEIEIKENEYYFYIKGTNSETGNYITSDVLKIMPRSEVFNRAGFAKAFVEEAGIKLDGEGVNPYGDVKGGEAYASYVQTLYNLGLLNTDNSNFYPENEITRGQVLTMVMNYFDADFTIPEGAPHFAKISDKNEYYIYAESLYAGQKAKSIWGNLNLEKPATREYLKYLIYAYRESN